MGLHHDEDGDERADRGRVIPPELLDRQSELFRGHGSPVADDELHDLIERVHPPTDDPADIVLPDRWERAGWDAGRGGPKTVAEAREVLAARIADPDAPDGPEVAGAYDDLDERG